MTIDGLDFPLKKLFVTIFGDRVFLVGGTVRDHVLYGEHNIRQDIDLVVEDHSFAEIEEKLRPHGKTNTVGKSFAVVKFSKEDKSFDISIPRLDRKKETGSCTHKNFIIEAGPHVTLEEDLARRDFTCNSIAVRLADNQVVDPFDGMGAIARKKILMTGPETFFDDPLRVLRAARFGSVHNFSVDEEIYVKSKGVPLDGLSPERVQDELFRLLLESPRPSQGLQEYFKLSALDKLYPHLYALSLTIQDAIFHPEHDEFGHHTVWAHTLATVDIAKKMARMYELGEEPTLALLLAALFHDVGKATATRWEFKRGRMTITSVLHDSRGVGMADGALSRLKVETRKNYPLKRVVLNLIKNHHRLYDLFRNKDDIGFKTITRVVRDLEGEDLLLVLLDFADRQSRQPDPLSFSELDDVSQWYLDKKESLNISQETIQPLVMGRDLKALGVSPGADMGRYLKILYDLQLDGEFETKAAGLEIFKKKISGQADKP